MGRNKPWDLAKLAFESSAWIADDCKLDFGRESEEGTEEEIPFIVGLVTGKPERSRSFNCSAEAFSAVSVAMQRGIWDAISSRDKAVIFRVSLCPYSSSASFFFVVSVEVLSGLVYDNRYLNFKNKFSS